MVGTSALILSALLASPQGKIKLPPPKPKPQQTQSAATAPKNDLDRLRVRLQEIASANYKAPALVGSLPTEFEDTKLPDLIVQTARVVRGAEMRALAVVAKRWGNEQAAKVFVAQLQIRPVGTVAIVPMVDAVAHLLGDRAKEDLFDCLAVRNARIRAAVQDQLEEMVGPEDTQRALSLCRQRSLDLKRSGIALLARIEDDAAREQLVDLLSAHRAKDLSICARACSALIRQGDAAAPLLLKVLDGPAIDHAWVYAAFALGQIEEEGGTHLLPKHEATLRSELEGPDALARALAAVPLARLAWRGAGSSAELDAAIIERLIQLVSPTEFVPNLDLLQRPAERALVRLSGQESPDRRQDWRDWWQNAGEGFVAMRQSLEFDPAKAGLAVLRLERGASHVWLFGEKLASAAAGQSGRDLLLSADDLGALIGELQRLGFLGNGLPRNDSATTRGRSLELRVGGAGYRIAANADARWFDRFEALVDKVVAREQWQFFRHPTDEPDFGAFWRAERKWIAAHPEPSERNQRLLDRVLRVWPTLGTDRRRAQAVQTLLAIPYVQNLVGETQGEKLVACVEQADAFGQVEFRILELALVAPGDTVWRDVLDIVDRQLEGGLVGSDAAARAQTVARLFDLLGPERAVASLADERKRVRLAALDQVAGQRIRSAVPQLLAFLSNEDTEVQRASVYALGRLRATEARQQLIDIAAGEKTRTFLRDEALVALGRIGGTGIGLLLERALAAPNNSTREATLRGLGELRNAEAAKVLAEFYASRFGDGLGELARSQLLAMGALLAVPALREQRARATEARPAIVQLLGDFEDPTVVPDLIALLDQVDGSSELRAVAALENTTGLAILGVENRGQALEVWYGEQSRNPQAVWFVAALEAAKVSHSLTAAKLADERAVAAVPELTRLLETLEAARLRVLCAAVLRDICQVEFGRVTASTGKGRLAQIASRYRTFADQGKAADGGRK